MGARAVEDLTTPFLHTEGLNSRTEKFIHETALYVLIAMAVFMASKPMFGTSIICQVPKDWPPSSVAYYHSFCYYAQKQKVGISRIFDRGQHRGNMTVNVLTGAAENYLWVPFIGFFQVALCLLPALFWKFIGLNFFHGSDIVCLLETFRCNDVMDQLNDSSWTRDRRAHYIQEWITAKGQTVFGKSRTFLVYVLMKWFRLILFIFQFWINVKLFGAGDLKWGLKIAKDFFKGIYINPFEGELSLMTGCEAQRLQIGVGGLPGREYTRVNSAASRCILSGNFINSKTFLFLYWWFLLIIIVCCFSAVRYTVILFCQRYRRYLFKSFIRDEQYFIDLCGPPHPDLNIGMTEPIVYLSDYLGNDGYLLWQIIFDSLHYFGSDKLTRDVFSLCIVNNGEMNYGTTCDDIKKEKGGLVDDVEHDGKSNRFRGGKDDFTEDKLTNAMNADDQSGKTSEMKRTPRKPSPLSSFDPIDPPLFPVDSRVHRS